MALGSDAGPMFVDDDGYPLIFKASSPALLDDEAVRLCLCVRRAHSPRMHPADTSAPGPYRTRCGPRT